MTPYDHEAFTLGARDDQPDTPTSPATTPTFGDVVNARLGRRSFLRGALATTALAAVPSVAALSVPSGAEAASTVAPAATRFSFTELARGADGNHHVAPGYDAKVLLRWGDPILPGAPAFDPRAQTAEKQLTQFGYNCDYTAFMPLPAGGTASDRGLLWVNHEYTSAGMMFPAPVGTDGKPGPLVMTKALVDVEMAAHGGSIVEVRRGAGGWEAVRDSRYNRRITALTTSMGITGPAAGHRRMKTSEHPDGRTVVGMLNNCAGGTTPWGTVLTCEENFDSYFIGTLDQSHPEQRNYDRYGVPAYMYAWGLHHARFDINKEPNEPNRFGWVVEIDPYDPTSTPRKHTALGRFKHEGAGVIVNNDGRVVVYMGDDQRFEFIYRFVSKGRYDPADRAANMRLLEEGTLYAARFDADGSLTWLPLVQGQGPLTAENGFRDQGDVVINARQAATLMGATRMDRPEDVEVNPKTHKVYAMLTNNGDRRPTDPNKGGIPETMVNAANPRPYNVWGHIVEMTPPGQDHTADRFAWEILVKGGDPAKPVTGAVFNPATTADGWFACPDNCVIDGQGRLWIGTDQGSSWDKISGTPDGLWALETEGPGRGTAKAFFRVPIGAELTGPTFTPDDKTLFLSVQHPGADGVDRFMPPGVRSSFDRPATRWPDFKDDMPPRPSVVVVTKAGGGVIGT